MSASDTGDRLRRVTGLQYNKGKHLSGQILTLSSGRQAATSLPKTQLNRTGPTGAIRSARAR
jgi:hypothetical protein